MLLLGLEWSVRIVKCYVIFMIMCCAYLISFKVIMQLCVCCCDTRRIGSRKFGCVLATDSRGDGVLC